MRSIWIILPCIIMATGCMKNKSSNRSQPEEQPIVNIKQEVEKGVKDTLTEQAEAQRKAVKDVNRGMQGIRLWGYGNRIVKKTPIEPTKDNPEVLAVFNQITKQNCADSIHPEELGEDPRVYEKMASLGEGCPIEFRHEYKAVVLEVVDDEDEEEEEDDPDIDSNDYRETRFSYVPKTEDAKKAIPFEMVESKKMEYTKFWQFQGKQRSNSVSIKAIKLQTSEDGPVEFFATLKSSEEVAFVGPDGAAVPQKGKIENVYQWRFPSQDFVYTATMGYSFDKTKDINAKKPERPDYNYYLGTKKVTQEEFFDVTRLEEADPKDNKKK